MCCARISENLVPQLLQNQPADRHMNKKLCLVLCKLLAKEEKKFTPKHLNPLFPLGATKAVIICFINWVLNMDPMPRSEF